MANSIDISGKRYGRWTVIHRAGRNKCGQVTWLCVCDCGTKREVVGSNLRSGRSLSCGCMGAEKRRSKTTKHGLYGTKFYNKWNSMLSRCANPNNKSYKHYGGRGIKVCERWKDFSKFKEDLYDSYIEHVKIYGEKNTTLDRIDVNGDYTMDNVRWATLSEQGRNRRNLRPDKYPGVYYRKKTGVWEAYITIDKKVNYLGSFKRQDDAIQARKLAEENVL